MSGRANSFLAGDFSWIEQSLSSCSRATARNDKLQPSDSVFEQLEHISTSVGCNQWQKKAETDFLRPQRQSTEPIRHSMRSTQTGDSANQESISRPGSLRSLDNARCFVRLSHKYQSYRQHSSGSGILIERPCPPIAPSPPAFSSALR